MTSHRVAEFTNVALQRHLDGGGTFDFEFDGRMLVLLEQHGRYLCKQGDRLVDGNVQLGLSAGIPGYVKIRGLSGMSPEQSLYLGGMRPLSILRIEPGALTDLAQTLPPHRWRGALERIAVVEMRPIDGADSFEDATMPTIHGYTARFDARSGARLYVGGARPFSVRLSTALLGQTHDVFGHFDAQVEWLEAVAPNLLEALTLDAAPTPSEAFERLYARPDYFGGIPDGDAFPIERLGQIGLVQPLTQGALTWAAGGPFAVAHRIQPGRWVAQQLTYGFARAFSRANHRDRLAIPISREMRHENAAHPVHPYPGSHQLFVGGVLHWHEETNRVWYQTWTGESHEK